MSLSNFKYKFLVYTLLFLFTFQSYASYVLIPMDAESQQNHLKAYGITYWTLSKDLKVKWLLNYRGGSFLLPDTENIRKECTIRGVSYEVLNTAETEDVLAEISSPSKNMEAVILEKAPKIAVYSPKGNQPWDDAVTMVLTFAEIPYETIYDKEVLEDNLILYDWLHLHHEDFTGQYGKFYNRYRADAWYIREKANAEKLANDLENFYSKPVNQMLSLIYNNDQQAPIEVKVSTLKGRVMYATRYDAKDGLNHHKIDVSNFTPGIYLVNLNNSTTQFTERIVKLGN